MEKELYSFKSPPSVQSDLYYQIKIKTSVSFNFFKMQWLVICITYINMVKDLNIRGMLYRMALYHLWELYSFFDADQPCSSRLWPLRATLAMWRGMLHMGYQELRAQTMTSAGGTLPPCSCALCVPPPYRMFAPAYFWQIWEAANLEMCGCPVCLQRPFASPYTRKHVDTATQTDPSVYEEIVANPVQRRPILPYLLKYPHPQLPRLIPMPHLYRQHLMSNPNPGPSTSGAQSAEPRNLYRQNWMSNSNPGPSTSGAQPAEPHDPRSPQHQNLMFNSNPGPLTSGAQPAEPRNPRSPQQRTPIKTSPPFSDEEE